MNKEQQRALAIARARQRQAQATDSMGFPTAPEGGVSVDSAAADELATNARSVFEGLKNGATYGLVDEGAGHLGAILGMTPNPDGGRNLFDYSVPYAERRASNQGQVREQQSAAREANPNAYMVGDIGGAGALAVGSAPYATGRTLLGTAGRGGAIGAGEGFLHGAGNAEDNRLAAGGRGALLGAGLGAAAPLAIAGGRSMFRAGADPATGLIDSMLGRANTRKANRAIADSANSAGLSADEAARRVALAASEGQPDYRLVDALGVPGQRRASGIARSGGDAADEVADFLQSRQLGQPERVGAFVDEAFGTNGNTAQQFSGALKDARSERAAAAYDAARGNASPVDVRGPLAVIDDRIGGMQGSGVRGDGIDARLSRYRDRLAGTGTDNVNRELSDFDRVLGVKQDLSDDIGAAVRAGRNNEARELTKLRDSLDSALEEASPSYRAANDEFAAASKVIDSVDTGAQMSRPSARAGDTTQQFSAMTPEQQQAARIGYGDSLLGRIEANSSPTANVAKPLQSPKRNAEAAQMAVDPELYARRLARENEMWATQNRALGGSRTADNLQDIESARGVSGGLMGAGRSLLNFQPGDALSKAAAALGPVARGENEATRELIARALLSRNPQAILGPAMRQDSRAKSLDAILTALLRGSSVKEASQ